MSSESHPLGIWKLKSARILVVNIVTNRVARLLGKDETIRWMNLAIYQGQPAKKSLNTVVSMTVLVLARLAHSLDLS